MFRRTAVSLAALALAAGLTSGLAEAASAQTGPGIVAVDLVCGPLVSDLTVNVTSGAPDTTYTVSVTIAGLSLGTTFTTNAVGAAVAMLPVPTALLNTVIGLLPVIVAEGGQSVLAPVAQVCGLL